MAIVGEIQVSMRAVKNYNFSTFSLGCTFVSSFNPTTEGAEGGGASDVPINDDCS